MASTIALDRAHTGPQCIHGDRLSEQTALSLFSPLLLSSALGAYDLWCIPINWIGQVASIVLAVTCFLRTNLVLPRGIHWHFACCFWLLLVTVAHFDEDGLSHNMPWATTTSYTTFVLLRVVAWMAFGCQVLLFYSLGARFGVDTVARRIIRVATWVAAFAIYVYVAQTVGLPEPPRNRIGTSGEEQVVHFTYAFHRAMGSFREPSHLAEWLVLPLFATLVMPGRQHVRIAVLLGSAMLLTGSLTGLSGCVVGAVVAAALFKVLKPGRGLMGPVILRLLILVCVAGAAFAALAVANDEGSTDVLSVLWERVQSLLNEGAAGSNRDYVYEYAAEHGWTLWGQGLGNPNLRFAHDLGSSAPVSFLSLYLTVLYSGGVLGLGLLVLLLSVPLRAACRASRMVQGPPRMQLFWMVSAYCGWLMMFAVHSEEPCLAFALVFALTLRLGQEYGLECRR